MSTFEDTLTEAISTWVHPSLRSNEIAEKAKAGTVKRLMAAHNKAVQEARVEENEYWREVSEAFHRGMLPVDFKDRIKELSPTTSDGGDDV